jgi:hypothetical protein
MTACARCVESLAYVNPSYCLPSLPLPQEKRGGEEALAQRGMSVKQLCLIGLHPWIATRPRGRLETPGGDRGVSLNAPSLPPSCKTVQCVADFLSLSFGFPTRRLQLGLQLASSTHIAIHPAQCISPRK